MQYRADQTMYGRVMVVVALLLIVSSVTFAQEASYGARFDRAWSLVAERYWNLDGTGLDWDEVGERHRPEAVEAGSEEEFYSVLERMYEELGDNHSVFVSPEKVSEIRDTYGALPCLPVLGQSAGGSFGPISYQMIEGYGYLEVPDLASGGVASGVRRAVRSLEQDDARGLILDLRGNPGGRLVEMMQVAGVFTGGFLWRVLTTWSLPIPYPAIGSVESDLPLAVLTDGDVNSAAEGLAGALQGSGRAVVIGEATAGNVEAVLPFCLSDGSQAWIATGVLAPIGGPSWEGRGVVPDLPVAPEDAIEVAIEYLNGQ